MWTEKNGKTYRIRELIAGSKITLGAGYETEKAADTAMTLMKADQIRGEGLVPRGGEMTLSAWIDLWWPTYKRALKATSQTSIAGIIDRYIKPMIGRLRLDEVQPLTVQGWVGDLLDGRTHVKRPRALASKTVRNAHGTLFMIFAAAINSRYLRHNPCVHTALPEEDDAEMMFLTHAQADQLVRTLPELWRPLVMVLLATGLRWSEAMGLHVRDIYPQDGRLYVRINTVELSGRFVDQTPKTKRGKRFVSYPPVIAEIFAPLIDKKKSDDRVFAAQRGGMIRHKEFYAMWHVVRLEAGLAGLRIHDLRHTAIAWLISAGVPLTAISRRVGHASISVTDGRYGHLLPEVDDGIMAVVEAAMRKIDFRGNLGEPAPGVPISTPLIPA